MTLINQLSGVRVFDLEQPRFAGMPVHPAHKPGYFYGLHRRHRDSYRPDQHGPRSGASGVLTMMEHRGTHIDALCHQACDLTLHGGVNVGDTTYPLSEEARSVHAAGAGPAGIAARPARTDRSIPIPRRLGRRAGLRGEYGHQLLQLGAFARGARRRLVLAGQVLEALAAAAAFVFKKRHRVF